MDSPESTVYRGHEGTGDAQIFGHAGDPMRAFYIRKQDEYRRQVIAAEQNRLKKEKRDKDLWELINVNPDKAWDPFNQTIIEQAKAHRQAVVNMAEKNGGNITDQVRLMAKNGWDNVNSNAQKSLYYKGLYDDTIKKIQENPYQKDQLQDYYFPKITELIYDKNGNAKPFDQIDQKGFSAIINDPGGYNLDKFAKDFVANPKENVVGWIKRNAELNGIDDYKVKTTPFYTADPATKSGLQEDSNGRPRITIDQDARDAFIDGSDIKKQAVLLQAQREGITPNQVIDNLLTKQIKAKGGNFDVDVTHQKPNSESRWMYDYFTPGLKPDEVPIANKVFENIGHIINSYYDKNGEPVSEASPEARAAIGHFKKGLKFGNGVSQDAMLVKGTNKPGTSNVMGMTVENSPNDRLIVKIKPNTKGSVRPEEIDLTDEGAAATLFNIFKESGYMGKKNFAFDDAAEKLNVDPTSFYRGKEYKALHQKNEQETINNWIAGNDIGKFTDKQFKGRRIVGVEKNTTLLGNFKGYKLKLDDGSDATIPKEDYESFTDIYRSKKSENNSSSEMIPVISPRGQKGSIPKNRLEDALKAGYKLSK